MADTNKANAWEQPKWPIRILMKVQISGLDHLHDQSNWMCWAPTLV